MFQFKFENWNDIRKSKSTNNTSSILCSNYILRRPELQNKCTELAFSIKNDIFFFI